MRFDLITIFPEMFSALNYGIVGRAIEQQIIQLEFWNPRDYSQDKHRRVDDRPYGGGPGMVMMAEPLHAAIQTAKQSTNNQAKVIHLTPQGKPLEQNDVQLLSEQTNLILLAGRYEGIDERLIDMDVDEEYSIGNYVLSGGELAAMVIVDAITRLLPEALGDEESAKQDSFVNGLLDHPHYTRPELFGGQNVPNVLLSGHHNAIARWRLKQALGRTYLRRPDLLQNRELSAVEHELLTEFINEQKRDRG